MRCLCGRQCWPVKLIARLAVFIIICNPLCYPQLASADLISPLIISNYNPMVAIHGLPHIGDAEVLGRGSVQARLMYDVSSHYADDANDTESILLDGETARTTFIYQQGIRDRWQLALVIPYLKHHGGGLDSTINNWHQMFDMPEGGRDQAANNQFQYTYSRHSQTRFDLRNPTSGLGDVRVQAAWALEQNLNQATALEVSVKLPTGDSDKLHGSGAVDVAMWYKNETRQQLFGARGGSFYSIGTLYLGSGDVLADLVSRWVGFGGIGGGVYLTEKLLFISQLDINTAFYSSSDLVEMGSHAMQLTLGGRILLSEYGRI
ncbi:MAG: DUF3187 family protein, partial [Gammaproteobacteria bacterium]|nr:DUF3187 family protein [Gammaproteobacteria bacterium]